ncbi:hypothetical protein COHA_001221 [Chlorella ohadii]|uniref:Uncharacterized protein n=1 Tax=Chlorella ohadii TaxID=2649997 RepID=A0AAD5DZF2_9CHLO|nr:hypothetical protein COHA_001221 [Chlorella ohadii]
MVKVQVQVGFGNIIRKGAVQELEIEALPTDSVRDCKEKVAAAAGGAVSADDLMLMFGPNDRKLGKQYVGDPSVDESKLLLSQYSLLQWVERFPHWKLTAALLPSAPLPPGVAIHKAAATAEHKDPDQAVADARAKGSIPKISDLPAPWGPKPFKAPPEQELLTSGYLPPRFPEGWSPLNDVDVGAA